MKRQAQRRKTVQQGWRVALAPACVLGLLAACAESTPLTDARDTFAGLYSALVSGTTGGIGGGGGQALPQFDDFEIDCPKAEVRTGTAHFVFYAPGEVPEPKNVRYQGTIHKVARECEFLPESVKIKFGFAGRVLLGPRGGEGEVVLPIRAILAWRNETVAWTKLYTVPVDVPPDARSAFFVHVTDDLDYTVPEGHRISEYRVYVGFDGQGLNAVASRAQ